MRASNLRIALSENGLKLHGRCRRACMVHSTRRFKAWRGARAHADARRLQAHSRCAQRTRAPANSANVVQSRRRRERSRDGAGRSRVLDVQKQAQVEADALRAQLVQRRRDRLRRRALKRRAHRADLRCRQPAHGAAARQRAVDCGVVQDLKRARGGTALAGLRAAPTLAPCDGRHAGGAGRASGTPSLVSCTSTSTATAPSSAACRTAASVFSGALERSGGMRRERRASLEGVALRGARVRAERRHFFRALAERAGGDKCARVRGAGRRYHRTPVSAASVRDEAVREQPLREHRGHGHVGGRRRRWHRRRCRCRRSVASSRRRHHGCVRREADRKERAVRPVRGGSGGGGGGDAAHIVRPPPRGSLTRSIRACLGRRDADRKGRQGRPA